MKTLSTTNPHLIIMMGIPGSGKTSFAEKFSDMFNAPYLNCPQVELLARDKESAALLADQHLHELLKTKQTIVYEGGSSTRVERMKLYTTAKTADYTPLLVWVQIDTPTAFQRAAKNAKQQGVVFDEDSFSKSVKRLTPPTSGENPVVISGKHTYTTQAKTVLKRLSNNRTPAPSSNEARGIAPGTPPRQRSQILIR